jgi:hypothetical protein
VARLLDRPDPRGSLRATGEGSARELRQVGVPVAHAAPWLFGALPAAARARAAGMRVATWGPVG